MFVGRKADLPNPGDARTVPGQPVFLVRNKTGNIRAFHNACRHRGHRLISSPCRGMKLISCPYHRWAYDLDGNLKATPHAGGADSQDLSGLDKSLHSLVPVRCETWHDWIFINMDGEAEPLGAFVSSLEQRLDFVDFGALRHFLTMEREGISANWKICMENTMEPYHVPFVHGSTAAGQPLQLHYMIVEDPVLGCGIDIPGSDYDNRPPDDAGTLTTLNMSARYLVRLPNFFITSYAPDVIVDTMIVPDRIDPRRCWMEQAWYTTSGRIPDSTEIAQWDELERQVIQEDIAVMTEVQAGTESPVVDDGGVLTPAWESCITAFYQHQVRALGEDRIRVVLEPG